MPEINKFSVKGLKKRRFSWDQFDNLPLEIKEKLWYLPFNAAVASNITTRQLEIGIEQALQIFAQSTYEIYGGTHPDAQRYSKTLPQVEDLF